MLSIIRKKCGITINDIFFSANPDDTTQSSAISFFIQAAQPANGFYQSKTAVINLLAPLDKIFSSFSSNTRYKIRRAERDGTTPETNSNPSRQDISRFSQFFDSFARQKGLGYSNRNKLTALNDKGGLIIFNARDRHGDISVAHAYVADRNSERIRLLYSASHFRAIDDTEERNRIGRANRLLHWHEISAAKAIGYHHYDLGGIPMKSGDPAKDAIARFKAEFGGQHIIEYNGYASRIPIAQKFIPSLRRFFI